MQFSLPANNLYDNHPVTIDIPDSWDVSVCQYAGANAPAMTAELRPRYLQLLEEDRALLTEYVAMLEEFAALRPCLPMTGMCENELYMYIDHAQWRMDSIEKYLKENR